MTTDRRERPTYRHGDLKRALLEAGIALAREGGPDAVVLREATRRAGVVPNAAYRHYADRGALLLAVRAAALSMAAHAMQAELDRIKKNLSKVNSARASVRAVGTAYLEFAQRETGLFRTAFGPPPAVTAAAAAADPAVPGPFLLLGGALDRFVEAGLLSPGQRPGAEFLAWSAVHGLALLIIDGPCKRMTVAQRHALGQRLLDMVETGLSAAAV